MLTTSTSQTGAPPNLRAALSAALGSKPNRVAAPVTTRGIAAVRRRQSAHGPYAKKRPFADFATDAGEKLGN
jgi:hypothetical protein